MRRFIHDVLRLAVLVLPMAACDLSPTDVDDVDAGVVEGILRTAGRRATDPATRVLFDLVATANDATQPLQLPQLDSLFGLALSAQAGTAPDRSDRDRQAHTELLAAGWAAIEAGDANTGENALAAARRFQAESVVRVFGAPLALVYPSLLDRSVRQAVGRLDAAAPEPSTARLRRMAATIRGIGDDARRAFASGDAAGALDLATHAAGLANTLQRELARHGSSPAEASQHPMKPSLPTRTRLAIPGGAG